MVAPILQTKLYISPLRTEIVPRPRLIKLLNIAVQRKLTLISAPAGFGKTTLLREWISESELPVAWLSLDTGDNDVARFWTYVIAALQTVKDDIGSAVYNALQNPQSPPIESLLTELINEIASLTLPAKDRNYVLVLDDYHVITERQVHETLTFLLDHLPPQIHLILSCRADPPWPLARLRTRREMTEIRLEDLRFTSQEASIFLNDVMGLKITPDELAILKTRTEGWIAGLQLAAISMQGRDDISGFVNAFSGSHRYILDYLMEEVLGKQSGEVQAFLLQTSILDQMNSSLCDAVTGKANGQQMLKFLEDANLFLISLDDQRNWYRYHHLFSELLHNQLMVYHTDEVSSLHQRASAWLEDQDLIDESIHHAFAARDNERVGRLIEKCAMDMLQQSKHSLLSKWIEALPEETIKSSPWLCVFQAWTRHWAGIREGGEECLEYAEQMLGNPNIEDGERQMLSGFIAAVRAHYALVNGDISRVIDQANIALGIFSEEDYYAWGTVAVAIGGAYWGKGNLLEAEQAFANCAAAALAGGYPFRASSSLCYQGMIQVRQGKLHQAENTYQKALALAQDAHGRRFPVAGYALAKLAEIAVEWNRIQQANIDALDGIKLCHQLGHVDLMAEAYIALARVQLAQGNYPEVEDALSKIEQLAQKTPLDPWVLGWLDDCRVHLWLETGDLDKAIDWAEASQLEAEYKPNFHADLNHIALARIRVAQLVHHSGQVDRNRLFELFDVLLTAAEQTGWIHHQIQLLVLQALVFQAYSDIDQAIHALAHALQLAEPSGYLRVFVNEGEPVHDLLSLMQEREQASLPVSQKLPSAFIERLLAVFRASQIDQISKTGNEPKLCDPLTPRELEILTYLSTNLTVPEIAQELVISSNTVRSHVKQIYGKLDVNRRLSAVQKARDLNLI